MKIKYGIYTLFIVLTFIFSCKKKENNILKEKTPVFKHALQKPFNGKLMGVVELGAAGFNSFIINVDEHMNWELKNRAYGVSLIVEGMTNTQLVNQKLRDYVQQINTFGVAKEDIYFVVSSGAAKEEITQIISKELKSIGYDVNIVTATQEGSYALKAVLPEKFNNTSFLVDLGSGNTKIGYYDKDETPIIIETHGAKYYQKGTEDLKVFTDVKKIIASIPTQKRNRCFIIGGVPSQLASLINKEEKKYTSLNNFSEVISILSINGGKKTKSGLNIYKAIEGDSEVKEIINVLDGNFTIGFLLNKLKKPTK